MVVFLYDYSELVSHQSQVFMEKECLYFLNHALDFANLLRISFTGTGQNWFFFEVLKLVRLLLLHAERFGTTLWEFAVKNLKFCQVSHRRHVHSDLGLVFDFFAPNFKLGSVWWRLGNIFLWNFYILFVDSWLLLDFGRGIHRLSHCRHLCWCMASCGRPGLCCWR